MPVSKQAWLKLPKAQRGNKSYAQYVAWTKKKTAQRTKATAAAAASDPFAGVDFSALAPTPSAVLLGQARATARASTLPIITQIQNAIARQRRAGIADINSATASAVKAVAPIPGEINQDYNTALAQQGATDQFLANFVRGQGQTAQADLGKTLAAAGLPTPDTGSMAALGQGAGAAQAAAGSTELSRLTGERAREMAYTQRLPAWYRSMGAQNVGKVSRQYADDLATQIGQVSDQVPGLVQTTYQNLLEREYNKAVARIGFQMDIGKTAVAASTQRAKAQAAAANPKINVGVSNKYNDGYAYDINGHRIPDGQGGYETWPVTTPKTTGAGKGKGPSLSLQKAALKIGTDIHTAMMTKLNTPDLSPGASAATYGKTPGGAVKDAIIARARQNATAQIRAFYKNMFPQATEQQIAHLTAGSLAAAGFPRGAHALDPKNYPLATTKNMGPKDIAALNTRFVSAVIPRAQQLNKQGVPPQKAWHMLVQYGNVIMERLGYQIPPQLLRKALLNIFTQVYPKPPTVTDTSPASGGGG